MFWGPVTEVEVLKAEVQRWGSTGKNWLTILSCVLSKLAKRLVQVKVLRRVVFSR